MNSFRLVPREKFLLGGRNEANFSDFSLNCHDQKWGLFRTFGSMESFSFQLGKSMKQEKYLQDDPNQNLKCLLAITLKRCISDPMLVKPNCV